MKSIPYETEIPLGFSTGENGSFSISATEFENFEAGTKVILIDKVNVNSATDISEGQTFTFNSNTTNNASRFSILFRAPGATTDVRSANTLNALVYVNADNQISIVSPENTSYGVYNAVGQLIAAGKTTGSTMVVSGYDSGVYIVRLHTNGQELTSKVIVK
jgi:hypothetical protein